MQSRLPIYRLHGTMAVNLFADLLPPEHAFHQHIWRVEAFHCHMYRVLMSSLQAAALVPCMFLTIASSTACQCLRVNSIRALLVM
jgi:hypothetical protein